MTTLHADSRNVKTTSLHLEPFHMRVDWGDMKGLAESIKAVGLLKPILVRERARSDGGGYGIISGARRHRGAEMAELVNVPVRVVEVDDQTAIQMMLDENLHQSGLHPLDMCHMFHALLDRGFDRDAIAKRYHMKKSAVAQRLSLIGLSERARKAFIAGTIDEPAALALATLDVHARQHDVLAAIAADALSVDDVPSYVQREFSASLDDVPWRVSDPDLLPKAGSCAACPKRTGAQRELFEEAAGDRCRDLACFRDKMEATFVQLSKRPGVVLVEQRHDDVFSPGKDGRAAVARSSGYVAADAPCPFVEGHTWRTAVELAQDAASPVPVYLARDQGGRPHFLYRETVAVKLVRRSPTALAPAGAPTTAAPRPEVTARQEGRARRAMVDRLCTAIVEKDPDSWGWIVVGLIDLVSARAQAQTSQQFATEIAELGAEAGRAGLVALATQSNRWAKRVAMALLVREEADVGGDLPPRVLELAALSELDAPAAPAAPEAP